MLLFGSLLVLLIYFIWAVRVWWRTVTKPRATGGRHDNTGGEWAPSHHDSGSSFDFGGGGDSGGGGDGGGGGGD